ncbi:hypothetical protein J6590_080012 [Homalodisca vitripennis]|nr:hypothetical protein J6590_080012 [Homalodisca vitripennis]
MDRAARILGCPSPNTKGLVTTPLPRVEQNWSQDSQCLLHLPVVATSIGGPDLPSIPMMNIQSAKASKKAL